MSYSDLLNETVVILSYTSSTDSFGSPTETFTTGDTINARLQPASAKENIEAGRQTTKQTFKVYIESDTTINQTDRIQYNSNDFDIVEKITYTSTYIRLVIQQVD